MANAALISIPTTPDTIGALVMGWGISCLVLGILFHQGRLYYDRYPNDDISYKVLVASLLVLEAFHQALVGHLTWFYTVSQFGSFKPFLEHPIWSLSVQIIFGAFVGAIVKICYGMRVWRFSNGNIIVTGLIIGMAIAQLGGAFAFTIKSFNTLLVDAATLKAVGTSSLALGAVTDLFTAAALSFFLQRMKNGHSKSVSLINRLITHSVNTGLLTSFTVLILYNILPMTFIFMAFYFILAKLYTVSCLATLNARRFVSGRGTDHEATREFSGPLVMVNRQGSRGTGNRLEVGIHQQISVKSEQSDTAKFGSQSFSSNHIPYTTGW